MISLEQRRGAGTLRILAKLMLPAIVAGGALSGCTTVSKEESPLRARFLPRWEVNEAADEEVGRGERAARNVRDGLVGFVDSFVQGAYSAFLTAWPTGSYLTYKTATFAGDVVGLIDDNEYSEHVFKGVFSRQLLRFGSGARPLMGTLGALHGKAFESPEHGVLDYVGNERFHTKVYGAPSGILLIGAIVGSDFAVRPAGNLILIFGGAKTASKLDKIGLDLIEKSAQIDFW